MALETPPFELVTTPTPLLAGFSLLQIGIGVAAVAGIVIIARKGLEGLGVINKR